MRFLGSQVLRGSILLIEGFEYVQVYTLPIIGRQ
jgi:hypothetical protein